MVKMLELKEKIKNTYAENETFLEPVLKFCLTFLALILVKFNVGYMDTINMWIVILGVSIVCAFLPVMASTSIVSIMIVMNIFTLSTEFGVLVLALVLIMIFLFFRFTPKQGVLLLIIPLAFFLKIPYAIPLAVGLLLSPAAIVSVACGTALYFVLATISLNEKTIINISDGTPGGSGINAIVDMIGNNGEMVLNIVAFSVTVLMVYFIRRQSINNAWTIAIIVGGAADFLIVLVGTILLDINTSLLWIVVGTILSIVLVYILQFFVFSLDYSRTEHTQFEDDEYYYYVKAVPKINVTAPEMNVKRINAQRRKNKKVVK